MNTLRILTGIRRAIISLVLVLLLSTPGLARETNLVNSSV
jgi:hypothetical protein